MEYFVYYPYEEEARLLTYIIRVLNSGAFVPLTVTPLIRFGPTFPPSLF